MKKLNYLPSISQKVWNILLYSLLDVTKNFFHKNKNVDDERRLFYVAITRAEKELYLSYVDMYNNKIKNISSFIEDIKDIINIIKPTEKDLK